ncbi:hypothetical protein [Modestobacter sp. Leaf380]|uniref:hypothetical protein n=1 Tax=Modestobacter sp. Leaf380 TaxID=1736356 RepID=UPI0012F8F9BE|nr:hypothetical protein [Modestobacter sp. Leaf380]
MRLRTLVPATLSAAALLLLPACGGSDDSADASSSSAASTSSAPQSSEPADADTEAFCTDAQAALTSIQGAITATASDPTQASAAFQQAADELAAVTPPDEIADAWQTLGDSFQQVADNTAGVDISTPEGQAQFQQVLDGLGAEADPASTATETYLTDNCGITDLTPAPTS